METALVAPTIKPPASEIVLARAAWDQFFLDALEEFHDPNPDLCRDMALDKTIRALGQRPKAALTLQQRRDLALKLEVRTHLTQSRRRPRIGVSSTVSRVVARKRITEDRFESLCDAASQE